MDEDTVKGAMTVQVMTFASIREISKVELSFDNKRRRVEAIFKKLMSPFAWSGEG